MSEDPFHDLLKTLADADATSEAPPEVELRLRKKFRSWKRRRTWRRTALWAPIAAAIILVIFALANRRPPALSVEAVEQDVTPAIEPVVAAPLPPNPKTERRATKRAGVTRSLQRAEIVTEFFPLMDPAPPLGRGQLVRIEVTASAMQLVGLPVHEEHLADAVQADVLLGEEGLPRAIRFVKYETR